MVPIINTRQLSEYLGVTVATIYDWRLNRRGPPAVKIGRHLLFRTDDVDDWLEEHTDRRPVAGELLGPTSRANSKHTPPGRRS